MTQLDVLRRQVLELEAEGLVRSSYCRILRDRLRDLELKAWFDLELRCCR